MLYHHKIPVDAFDDSLPWEKELYTNMFAQKIEEENEKMKLQEAQNRATRKSRRR